MQSIVQILSVLGLANSFVLVIYALKTKKGSKIGNFFFAILIVSITLRVSHSVIVTFYSDLNDFYLITGLVGFLSIGPSYFYFIESIIDKKFNRKKVNLAHFAPAFIVLFSFPIINVFRENEILWQIFNRTVLLQYIIYLTFSSRKIIFSPILDSSLRRQLKFIGILLLSIWLVYLINDVSGIPYISGAILYSILVYFSLIVVFNKGYIVDYSRVKYEKSGLSKSEENRILNELNTTLIEKKLFTNNTLSLSALANKINTNNHALSEVINKTKKRTFYELIRELRIEEAKKIMKEDKIIGISDVAYKVGYNSISSFNKAFKMETGGLTPSKYRDEVKI
ncbi:MAG: helix-turn-helix domain-containing protein [Allomuricauda sp.]